MHGLQWISAFSSLPSRRPRGKPGAQPGTRDSRETQGALMQGTLSGILPTDSVQPDQLGGLVPCRWGVGKKEKN